MDPGYTVLTPDFEGLGTAAQAPYPCYSFTSLGRSLAAAARAAHHAIPRQGKHGAAVGHSDGGHAVIAVKRFSAESAQLDYCGTVAFAPCAAIRDEVDWNSTQAASDPGNANNYVTFQNLLSGMMATGLIAQHPIFAPARITGSDMLTLMPTLKCSCIFVTFGAIGGAIPAKTPAAFNGLRADWASDPAMAAFLAASDPCVRPGHCCAPRRHCSGSRSTACRYSLRGSRAARARRPQGVWACCTESQR